MNFRLLCIGAGLASLLQIPNALAHHSGAMFEAEKTIELTGFVKEFQYSNPHAWLIVDVKNADGTTTTWGVEAPAGPSTLINSGIHKSDLIPGTQVTFKGHPMRDGRPATDWVQVVRTRDGRVFKITGL